ncbi:MAG: CRISPR-associated endonuclease Cas2 [Opitutales bacterium]|nr:CRISPR-associated endonuclease Cas2 [Opitutales bacterium]
MQEPKSGNRLMWMMVMFDLPVVREIDRKRATAFRNMLLDNGFEMSQFSVYFRFCGEKERTKKYVRIIETNAPEEGNISILFFTDKQFAQTINICKKERVKQKDVPEQLNLF